VRWSAAFTVDVDHTDSDRKRIIPHAMETDLADLDLLIVEQLNDLFYVCSISSVFVNRAVCVSRVEDMLGALWVLFVCFYGLCGFS
jgi:hypothetical protein